MISGAKNTVSVAAACAAMGLYLRQLLSAAWHLKWSFLLKGFLKGMPYSPFFLP
jgi:hypothetical protein